MKISTALNKYGFNGYQIHSDNFAHINSIAKLLCCTSICKFKQQQQQKQVQYRHTVQCTYSTCIAKKGTHLRDPVSPVVWLLGGRIEFNIKLSAFCTFRLQTFFFLYFCVVREHQNSIHREGVRIIYTHCRHTKKVLVCRFNIRIIWKQKKKTHKVERRKKSLVIFIFGSS